VLTLTSSTRSTSIVSLAGSRLDKCAPLITETGSSKSTGGNRSALWLWFGHSSAGFVVERLDMEEAAGSAATAEALISAFD
jgi:hypothetical protein